MLAIFGIDGGALSLIIQLLVLFLIVTYVALIYWTYMDAKRRIEDPVLIACATAASVFPFIGTIVYTILRPPEFLEDREERELELRAAELRLRQLIEQSCPHCEYPIEHNFLRCPNCERRLRSPCRKCGEALDPKWGVCPYCETAVRRQRPESGDRESRRRTRSGSGRTAPRSGERPASGSGNRSSSDSRESRESSGSRSSDEQRRQSSQRPTVSAQSRPQQRPSGGSGSGGQRSGS